MSTPLAAKFQDHYDVLGVEPKCDSGRCTARIQSSREDIIPTIKDTGNQAAFDSVNAAYEVLSDPAQRFAFDNLKGIGEDANCPQFSGAGFFESLGSDAGLRAALLCILYERRKSKPLKPGLPMRYVEAMLEAGIDELFFVLWYLKQRGWVSSDDKSNLLITVQGMDYLDSNRPSAAMVLPHIKPSAIAHQEAPANALVAALDAASANRAFKNEESERTGGGLTSPAGPN
ncbi:MAG: hypothetical protein ABI833_15780 [Acidobacteriota bacterium]